MSIQRQSYSEYERKWLRLNFKRDQPQHILQDSFFEKFKGKRISQATVSQSLSDDWAYLDRYALEELSKTKFRRPKEPRKRKTKQRLRSVDLRDFNRKSGNHDSPYSPRSGRRPSISTSSWAGAYSSSASPIQPAEYSSPMWSYPSPPLSESDRACTIAFNAQSTYNFSSLTLASPTSPTSQPSFSGPWCSNYDTSIDTALDGYFIEEPETGYYFYPPQTHQDRGPLRVLTNVSKQTPPRLHNHLLLTSRRTPATHLPTEGIKPPFTQDVSQKFRSPFT